MFFREFQRVSFMAAGAHSLFYTSLSVLSMMLLQKKGPKSVRRLHHANLSWDLDETSCSTSNSSSDQFWPESTAKSAPQQQHSHTKRVTFDLTRNTYHSDATSSTTTITTSLYHAFSFPSKASDRKNRWYRGTDLRAFRSEVALLGRQTSHRRNQQTISSSSSSAPSTNIFVLVRDLYQDCQNSSNNSSNNHDEERTSLSSALEQSYSTLLANQPELVGIERFALEAIMTKQHKARRRQQLLQAANPPSDSFDNRALVIRQACEELTAASRGFAVRVGQMHARVAASEAKE